MKKRIVMLQKNKITKENEHHIWCNYWMKDRKTCKMCERLFKEYPMDKTPDEMLKKYFPDVKKREGT